ncbi:MAG TPA: glycerol-3-phosphate dehydrogenase/oxidase [Acidimicrobiia bacterium]|nr:glycerol-3-phosphate dehydrogenase/oxidase [Acidimicrobiia bacterium]
MPTSKLNTRQRALDLSRMRAEVFDIVVIGGGVTGCGIAVDAATRGLSVALVEQRDYASGTSSRSSKLFHGGLRYLEHRNLTLVREALAERNLMVNRLCPHLCTPVSFLYPLHHPVWERLYVGAGVLLYDTLASRTDNPLPRHRQLSRRGALEMAPALANGSLKGGVLYWDVLVDDARHTMTLARTAKAHGAVMAQSTRANGLLLENGAVVGVRARDLEAGADFDIRARRVIAAGGVWSDDIQAMAGDHGQDVRASKGIHLVVPRDRIDSRTGLILRTERSVLFVIPWGKHWLIGTTDTPWSLRRAHPAACRSDIEYLLRWVNSALASPIGPDDVVGVYAGLRPLLAGESDETSKLSREHAVIESGTGLITVAGGKYTTYRVMARDAVDAATRGGQPEGSRTDTVPLLGAAGYQELWERRAGLGVDPAVAEHLLGRHGSTTFDLLAAIEADPGLGQPLIEGAPYLRAEIVHAVTDEGALHLDDVLTRRTRISIESRDRGTLAAPLAAEIMARPLGWDRATLTREIEHYLARVEAELDSQRQPDDRTADAARMGAPDVRTGRAE